jgi:DNA polymerase IV
VRKIIRVEAFYASVEWRDDPELRGKPVIVVWRGKQLCRAPCFVRGKQLRRALSRAGQCERNTCVPKRLRGSGFHTLSVPRSVGEIFQRHTDLIEPLSLDDVSSGLKGSQFRQLGGSQRSSVSASGRTMA